jgi:hypothetical protein
MRGQVCLLAVFRQYQSIMSHYLHRIFTLSVSFYEVHYIYNVELDTLEFVIVAPV